MQHMCALGQRCSGHEGCRCSNHRHTRMHVRTYAHAHMHAHVRINAHACAYTYAHPHARTYTRTRNTCASARTCACAHTQMHPCTNSCTNVCMYAHIHTCMFGWQAAMWQSQASRAAKTSRSASVHTSQGMRYGHRVSGIGCETMTQATSPTHTPQAIAST